jgi:hypothetical protein
MAYDVEGARKAGFSDAQINEYLAEKAGYNIWCARNAGFAEPDIFKHLTAPKPTTPAPKPTPTEVEGGSDFLRGIANIPGQFQEIGGAAQALAGVATGSKDLTRSGLETMEAGKSKQSIKATDEFTEAWKRGIGTVITDWLPYQIGSGVGNLAETLAFMGVGAGAGAVTGAGVGAAPGAIAGFLSKQLAKQGIKDAAESLIKKETAKAIASGVTKAEAKAAGVAAGEAFIADESKKILEATGAAAAKQYASSAAKSAGVAAGMGAQAGMHGLGEVGGRAFEEGEKRGERPEDVDLARVLPAAAGHALADFVADKIMLGAFKPVTKEVKNGLAAEIGKRILTTGTKELGPEEVQTLAERWGAKLSLTDAEAIRDYINTAGASYAMSVIPGIGGGIRSKLSSPVSEDKTKTTEDAIIKAGEKPAEETTTEAELPPFTPVKLPDGTTATSQADLDAYNQNPEATTPEGNIGLTVFNTLLVPENPPI